MVSDGFMKEEDSLSKRLKSNAYLTDKNLSNTPNSTREQILQHFTPSTIFIRFFQCARHDLSTLRRVKDDNVSESRRIQSPMADSDKSSPSVVKSWCATNTIGVACFFLARYSAPVPKRECLRLETPNLISPKADVNDGSKFQ